MGQRRIALIMLDTVDMPAVFWGAIKAGVVPIPMNTLLAPDALAYMIEDSRSEAVVISHETSVSTKPGAPVDPARARAFVQAARS